MARFFHTGVVMGGTRKSSSSNSKSRKSTNSFTGSPVSHTSTTNNTAAHNNSAPDEVRIISTNQG